MTDDLVRVPAMGDEEHLELITSWLNGQLDPERVEQVRRRLDDDPAFRELAAPMLLTWSVPKHLERHPRPAGELECNWDDFTRRAGFAHQRRASRRRRLWLLALAFVGVGVAAYAGRAPMREWYVTWRDFVHVPHDTGWVPLGAMQNIFAQQAPGASLRSARQPARGDKEEELRVLLEGTARFRVLALDSITPTPPKLGLVVRTRAGLVSTGEAEFTVTTRGDTSYVDVQRPSRRRFMYFVPLPTAVMVRRDPSGDPLMLRELDRARLVRHQQPQRLIETKEP